MSAPFERFTSGACLTRRACFAALMDLALADLSDDSKVMETQGTPSGYFLNLYEKWRRDRSVRSEFLPVLRRVLRHPRVRRELQACVFRHGLPAMSHIETTFTQAIQAAYSLYRLRDGVSEDGYREPCS